MWFSSGDYQRLPLLSADATDMVGIAVNFWTPSQETKLPSNAAREFGFAYGVTIIQPGAFDRSLSRKDNVRLLVDHNSDSELRRCSVSSGALRLFANKESLLFFVSGSSRTGRGAVRWAKAASEFRQVSIGFWPIRYEAQRRTGTEMWNTLIVYEARLEEISLVKSGAFPGTKVEFG